MSDPAKASKDETRRQEAELVLFENELEAELRDECDAYVLAHPWRYWLVLVKRWWAGQGFLK
ncbi:MAG: hypothetical protein H0U99_07410 [Chthoniobacterales bacterium]|nr:hypothetical protein [Chthoniobacterales bacterium]